MERDILELVATAKVPLDDGGTIALHWHGNGNCRLVDTGYVADTAGQSEGWNALFGIRRKLNALLPYEIQYDFPA